MNEIINKYLLKGDKFMPEMHLRQPGFRGSPGFTYSACVPFTKHKARIKKFEEMGDTRYIYRNDLDKACFQHNSAYADLASKDLASRTRSEKVLRDKAFNIANNPKYDSYQRGLASMVYNFFDKKSSGGNLELANELHKPIIRKFNKRKVYSSYKDNIWGVDLAHMRLLSRRNRGIKYLLCAIDMFSKYAFVAPLKDKKGASIVDAFQDILDKSGRKPNIIWVDQGSEFCNSVFKKWLKNNGINMYSTYNEAKSVITERVIRTLKNKLYKNMTAVSRNVYYDVLDNVVKKYNNTVHSTTGMKPKNVKYYNVTEYIEESNKKDPTFKIGDRVRMSRYKNVFAKGYAPNWSEEVFVVSKVKNTVPWTYELNDSNGEKILGSFMKKSCKRPIRKNLGSKK